MTARRRGGSSDGGPGGPANPGDAKPAAGEPSPAELRDDPLQRPASDAGWDDERPRTKSSPPEPTPARTAQPATAAAPAPLPPDRALPADDPGTPAALPGSITQPSSPAPTGATTTTTAAPTPASTASTPPAAATSEAPATSPPDPPAAAAAAPAAEEPLLPASYNENDLRSAVGASPIPTSSAIARKRRAASFGHDGDDDSDDPPRRRRTLAVPVFTISVGVAIAVLVLLGRANSDRYRLACEAERAVPQQGRAFPPWGTRALAGDAWTPLKITPETRCQPRETDDILALERQYLAMILDQATALLTAREVTALDDADALLKQALLLTRPPEAEPAGLAKERNQRHEDIQRLLGDVTYGRASAKLHDAATNLTDAAKQFDAAAAQHPRHATDASAWATYARHVAQELHAGPLGAAAPTAVAPTAAAPTAEAPVADRPTAPLGVALPVEPGHPTPRDPAIPSTVDPAKPTASDPAPAAPPAVDASAPPGASPPAGGVLL